MIKLFGMKECNVNQTQKIFLIGMLIAFLVCWFGCYRVSGDVKESLFVSLLATMVGLTGFPT